MMQTRTHSMMILCLLLGALPARAQQVPDKDYRPPVTKPAYGTGQGPAVCLDEAHNNFHTLDNRFWAFGELLRRDGYVVMPGKEKFTAASLARCRVLVIANAAASGRSDVRSRSAFSPQEIEAVKRWVSDGGSLLLIADHRPYGGAAADLAAAFGLKFTDGFALEARTSGSGGQTSWNGRATFRTSDGSLRSHAIVRGRNATESVSSVQTFTGQAFPASPDLEPLLVFLSGFSLLPDRPASLAPGEKGAGIDGWLQGGAMTVGTGRAAFFGEAAMFSAQVSGPDRTTMGMNAPGADQNHQFVLNVLHWLTGLLR